MYIRFMSSDADQQGDLWSRAEQRDAPRRDPRLRLLPHDLDVALKHLTDGELATLSAAVGKEQARRGHVSEPEKVAAPEAARASSELPDVEGLTRSQVSLIRASIKAGVKPGALSRQFGINQAQIRAALK
jgi:hypothetical protein